MEVIEKTIGENTFYIKKFPAFTAAKISGDLMNMLAPLVGAFLPSLMSRSGEAGNIMNMDIETAMPTFMEALGGLSGDKVEYLLKKLLTDYGNISVQGPDTDNRTQKLDYDLANEIFCGEVDYMYRLAFEVIKLNYDSFFKNFGVPSGNPLATGAAGTSI